MPNRLSFPGSLWSDVCVDPLTGQWLMVSYEAATKAIVCREPSRAERWRKSVGIEAIGLRCANDNVGRVAAVAKRQDNGFVIASYDGQLLNHAKLNVNVHGPTGIIVAFDFQAHEWIVWRMADGFTLATLRIDPNPFRIGDWHYQDIRHLMPEGTADGFSYVTYGEDGQPVPHFTLLTRNRISGLVNAVPAGQIWVGQHPSDGLAGVQEGIGRQTFHQGDAFEPHAVEYAPGKVAAVSWHRMAKVATVVEIDVPLTPDPVVDIPIENPGRPVATALYYHRTQRYRETYRFSDTWDIVADEPIPLARPSIIGPVAIQFANPDLVKGLYVGKEASPVDVEQEIQAVRATWTRWHPTKPIPPVVVYVTEKMRSLWPWVGQTSADVWSPELYWPLDFPDDPIEWMRLHVEEWRVALDDDKPWAPTCQAYDRNGAHAGVMDQVIGLQGLFTTLAQDCEWVTGLLFFDCNRSGFVNYRGLADKYEAIAVVCEEPEQIGPFRPVPPPHIRVTVDRTTVEPGDKPVFMVVPLEDSGTITEIEWYQDRFGDGLPMEFFDRTYPPPFTNIFWLDEPGEFQITAKAKGPGGADTAWSPRIIVQEKEEHVSNEEKKQLMNEFSLAILRTRDWLTNEVYPGLVGHPIDVDGYNQWLLNQWMRHYVVDLGYDEEKAKLYTFGDIHKQLHGVYPPTDPRVNAGGGGGGGNP